MSASPLLEQRRAGTPDASIWVIASAGTGKTKVLVDRVLGLLLAGTQAHRILCLTFTRAAAAEMANRIRVELGKWAVDQDSAVDAKIAEITGSVPDVGMRRRARRLFSEVLNAPGGIKIQTIHSFCESVLGRFPLEAGLAPHFDVMDERTAAEAIHTARDALLFQPQRDENMALANAVAEVTARIHEDEFFDLMSDLARQRGRIWRLLREHGLAGFEHEIRRLLGVAVGESDTDVVDAASDENAFDGEGLRAAVQALSGGSPTDQKRGAVIATWLEDEATRQSGFDNYCRAYITNEETVRKTLITKAAQATAPNADGCLRTEGERLAVVRDRRRAVTVATATSALITLAERLLATYEAHKTKHALLDYDDLIQRVRTLLESDAGASWVLFKLDGGIDHILVDEAQDTNPDQWAVIRALAEEFFVGARVAGPVRTIFAVGDAKQSIFSFQGADPAEFFRMQSYLEHRAAEAKERWKNVGLDLSFRSTPAVLRAVDAVFARPDARDGLGVEHIGHVAHRIGQAGLVELWPPVQPVPRNGPSSWLAPNGDEAVATPSSRLAQGLAAKIADWMKCGEKLASRARPMRPGDILVLVRRRTALVDELVDELKGLKIPVAGVDRMVLTDQLAIMDLVALGQFLLLPEDDLTLATVLKGPLIGFDEELLFELAYDRRGATLWHRLGERAQSDPQSARAFDGLSHLRSRVDYIAPHELYTEILGSLGGRKAIIARMGEQAIDPLDEFLTLALTYERSHPPSLQGFLRWFTEGRTEVKRDLEQIGRNEVRVMTVHGAKGLQAPVVILADTMQTPDQSPKLLWSEDESNLPFWAPRRADEDSTVVLLRARANAKRDQEYRRLLYVAMTRAEDRLIICGYETNRAPPSDCWYELVRQGLAKVAEPVEFNLPVSGEEAWSGPGLRLATPQSAERPDKEEADVAAGLAVEALPNWALERAPVEPTLPRPLAPSRPNWEEPGPISPLGIDDGTNLRRGNVVHRLLQSLPDVDPARRADAALRYLSQPIHDLSTDEQDSIATETMAIVESTEFAPLFGPNSLAEQRVVGRIGDTVVSGQIDRLALTSNEVLIVDYKSHRTPPDRIEDVPLIYLEQLAAYRTVLSKIYPNQEIRCALLWTTVPRLMAIDTALLLDP